MSQVAKGRALPEPKYAEQMIPLWYKALVLGLIFGTAAAVLAGGYLISQGRVGWFDVLMFLSFYLIIANGVTMGDHRLFAHGSFEAHPALKAFLAASAHMALMQKILDWVANHIFHHIFSDTEYDLHSPIDPGHPFRGFLHAHLGWIIRPEAADRNQYAKHLLKDRMLMWFDRTHGYWVVATFVLPIVAGAIFGPLAGHTWYEGIWRAFLWGGLIRIFFIWHVTWSINSLCHMWGYENFKTTDHSRNFFWWTFLWLFSLGEAWHNGHHWKMSSAWHGMGWPKWMDPTYMMIKGLEKVGLAWDVTVPSDDVIRQNLARS